eukprot:scaffold50531_cov36-Phaeocystis_antarctica.AAC.1
MGRRLSWWARYSAAAVEAYNAGRAAELARQACDPPIRLSLRALYMEGCSITKEKARGTEKAQAARDNMHKELVDVGGDVGGIDSWTGRSRRAYSSIRVRRSRRVAPPPPLALRPPPPPRPPGPT